MNRKLQTALGAVLIVLGIMSLFPAEALHVLAHYRLEWNNPDALFVVSVLGGFALVAGVWLLALGTRKMPMSSKPGHRI